MTKVQRVISQPWSSDTVGSELLTALSEPFSTLDASVGFVNASGVRHLAAALEEFRAGGGSARFVVGVDGEITSETGVRALRRVVDELFLFRHPGRPLFHPKTYVFRSETRGLALIGSANLTESALWINYEDLLAIEFDLTDPSDAKHLNELSYHHDQLRASPNAHRADDNMISRVKAMGLLPSELERRRERHRHDASVDRQAAARDTRDGAQAIFPQSAVLVPPVVPLLPEEEEETGAETSPERALTPPPRASRHSVFVMRLGNRDAGSQPGFSPDVFIPIAAHRADPDFWGELTPMTTEKGYLYEERRVPIEFRRLNGDIQHDSRRLYSYERKDELRLNARQIHEDSEPGDLMTLELAPQGLDFEFVARVVKPTDPLFERYDEIASNAVQNSDKRWGYGGQIRGERRKIKISSA